MSQDFADKKTVPVRQSLADPLDAVAKAIAQLRFGAINLTMHEGRVVQMDVTERKRFF